MVVIAFFSSISAQRNPASWEIDWLKQLNAAGKNDVTDGLLFGVSQSIYPSTVLWGGWLVTEGIIKKQPEKVKQGSFRMFATGIAFSTTMLLKYTVRRERPDPAVFAVPFLKDGFSFPSGHAALASAIATTIFLEKKPWYWCSAGVVGCLLIAYTRPYLGVHYPGDILAGIMVGTSSALLAIPFRKTIHRVIDRAYTKKSPSTNKE